MIIKKLKLKSITSLECLDRLDHCNWVFGRFVGVTTHHLQSRLRRDLWKN